MITSTLSSLAYHHDDGDGWFPWFPLIPLFFFALWIAFFVFVARRWGRFGGPGGPGGWSRQSAQSVLAERYARGEIDETEYQTRRAVLRRKD